MCLLSEDDDSHERGRPQVTFARCPDSNRFKFTISRGYALPFFPLTAQVVVDTDGDGQGDTVATVHRQWVDTNRNGVPDYGDDISSGQPVPTVVNDRTPLVWGPSDTKRVMELVVRQDRKNLTDIRLLRSTPDQLADTLASVRR